MEHDEPIRQQLNAGEHLLWSDRPRQGVRPTFEEPGAGLLVAIVFLLLWLFVVAIVTLANVRDVEGQLDSGALSRGLFLLAFGGILLYIVCSSNAVIREHTFYGLTDQRIIHVTGAPPRLVRSYPLHYLQHLDVQVRDDGSGTITFEAISYTRWDTPVVLSFHKVENVQMVYDLIRSAKEQAYKRGTDG